MSLAVADIRRELQDLAARERELIHRADQAVVARRYVALRDIADELVKVATRQAELRQALGEAQGRGQAPKPTLRRAADDAADTWRLLH